MAEAGAATEAMLCALLRGETTSPPVPVPVAFDKQLHACVAYHGVGPLLSRQFTVGQCLGSDRLKHEFPARQVKDAEAMELARREHLVRVLGALAAFGVKPLLLKGAALAYSVYPSPGLRPRADTDLLIRNSDRDVCHRVLSDLGYEKVNAVHGELVQYQCGYTMQDRFGIGHVLDVHWRISNTQLFSQALEYEELSPRAISLKALGERARGPAPVHALLHACMHRAHHLHSPMIFEGEQGTGGDRLIWLYDIYLLVEFMSRQELVEFAALAERKRIRAVCRDGLLRASEYFGTGLPEEVLLALTTKGAVELSAAHLRTGRIHHLLTEIRSLPRWQDRVRLVKEHLFPPMDYMLEKYSVSSRAWLPVLYLKRGIHGVWKRIQSP
jgi:hypothetical protein